ncbi:flagellar hook-associated protein FlgL [Pseudarthrobacter sp. BIM B-2242]|uniref:flagellar hook-associated protein FlgL n=1 Tax=Pseudarthrobacter sp. BIM B-2242 TaxID=2772401 RepID=UPI00168B91C4|nr:flagellar hook-associated protein FlgL [Pseudarthrobacter sp. BIM B-2242]QOD05773.1 flagellar hook-associated protein FlgL [Pseudarthrobacter sp. BIM B-2242]
MSMRVTNQTLMASAQRNLQANKAHLASLQTQVSDLKRITRPSDDPTGTGSSLQVRAQQAAAAQYSRNIDNGRGWLTTADTAMTNSTDILRRVKDLTIQGSSDVLTPEAKEGIAAELEGLKQNLLSQANATFMGRNVFAGNSDAGVAFTSSSPAAYTGTGSTVDRRVADGVTVRVDADGAAIFGTGAGSAFDLIDKIAADLRSGANAASNISALDKRMSTLVAEHAAIGARDAQIQRAQDVNVTQQGNLEATRAGIEDVDMSKAILDLQLTSTNYEAALAVAGRILPRTLMDFLR